MSDQTPTNQTPTENPEVPFAFESLQLEGNDISQYTIVYRRHNYFKVIGTIGDKLLNDYDFDRLSAERLSDLIFKNFGVRLTVAQDTKTDEGEYEILVGQTNRDLHPTDLTEDQYVFLMSGKKLVMCGGAYGTTWHAADAFEGWIEAQKNNQVSAPNFTTTDAIRSEYHLKTVSCIGDSITYASTATNPEYLSYPANLQRLLWKDYLVFGYGKSATTMRNDLEKPYTATAEYQAFIENPIGYDLVLIMLGTNETYYDLTWTDSDTVKYKNSMRGILDAVKVNSPSATFVLMNAPAYYGNGNHARNPIREVQREAAETLYGEGYDLRFYDMYQYSSTNMGKAMFPDSLHPSDEGYVKMAEGVRELVLAIMEQKDNPYLIPLTGKTDDTDDDTDDSTSDTITFTFNNQDFYDPTTGKNVVNPVTFTDPNATAENVGDWSVSADVYFDASFAQPNQRIYIYIETVTGETFEVKFQRRFAAKNLQVGVRYKPVNGNFSEMKTNVNTAKNGATFDASGATAIWTNTLNGADRVAAAVSACSDFRLTVQSEGGLLKVIVSDSADGSVLFEMVESAANLYTNAEEDAVKSIRIQPDQSKESDGTASTNYFDVANLQTTVDGIASEATENIANYAYGEGWTMIKK